MFCLKRNEFDNLCEKASRNEEYIGILAKQEASAKKEQVF